MWWGNYKICLSFPTFLLSYMYWPFVLLCHCLQFGSIYYSLYYILSVFVLNQQQLTWNGGSIVYYYMAMYSLGFGSSLFCLWTCCWTSLCLDCDAFVQPCVNNYVISVFNPDLLSSLTFLYSLYKKGKLCLAAPILFSIVVCKLDSFSFYASHIVLIISIVNNNGAVHFIYNFNLKKGILIK